METSSNTKSHGKFLSKIRPLLLRKDIIQDCFDHCAITDSSLKLLSTISVQGVREIKSNWKEMPRITLDYSIEKFLFASDQATGTRN